MAPSYAVELMDHTHEVRSFGRYKRDIPPQQLENPIAAPADAAADSNLESPMPADKVWVVAIAASGSLLLVIALIFFYICMKRRHASCRIGQQQEFLSDSKDEKSTNEHFKKQATAMSSASTLVPLPSNVHHRTRSAPITFAKGYCKSRRSSKNEIPVEQFQQISLAAYVESEDEIALKKSLATGPRNRSLSVTIPKPTLHRSVSLNNHGTSGYVSRSPPIEEESAQDADPLPTTTNLRFGGDQHLIRPTNSRDQSNLSRRFSSGASHHLHRRSTSSAIEFDPSQFKTTTGMFNAKRYPAQPDDESSDESDDDDTISTASSGSLDHLPAHLSHHNFETHNPYIDDSNKQESQDISASPPHPHHIQRHVTYTAPQMLPPVRKVEGIAFKMAAPLHSSRIMVSRAHGGQEMSPDPEDSESEDK